MRECFEALVGGPVTDRQWEQVQLTTRDGGFGITDQRHVMHCGYLASWVAVWGLLRRTCPLLAPILGDMEHGTTSAHRSVQRSHDYCRRFWDSEDGDAFPISLETMTYTPGGGRRRPPTPPVALLAPPASGGVSSGYREISRDTSTGSAGGCSGLPHLSLGSMGRLTRTALRGFQPGGGWVPGWPTHGTT